MKILAVMLIFLSSCVTLPSRSPLECARVASKLSYIDGQDQFMEDCVTTKRR